MGRSFPSVAPGPSLYGHIRSHLTPDGRFDDESMALPDDPQVGDDAVRWMPGALDGVMGHHAGAGDEAQHAATLADLVVKAGAKPTKRTLKKVYAAASEGDSLGAVDAMIERIAAAEPPRSEVRDVGRWLATTGSERGAVKIGLALLGAAGLDDDDAAIVLVLGAHEEFALFAAVAVANGVQQPARDRAMWSLAKRLDGWGRIQCVERLATTEDPEIREWILRDGFRNSVMYEYLAYTAATTGRLLPALQRDEVDRDLLTSAGDILQALVAGGPAQDLDDWADGADAVEAYLSLLRSRAETMADFLVVSDIRGYLDREDGWDERSALGWTATRRTAFEDVCDEILERPRWAELATQGLGSEDKQVFWQAETIAERLGIDTFDALVERIVADPLQGPWFQAWRNADRAKAERLVQLARDLLPLDEIASGPGTSLGLGPDHRVSQAAEWSLQALRDHEGVGGDLVLLGLRSPVIRSRNMSLVALQTWSRDAWPAGTDQALATVIASDPSEKVRELAADVARSGS